MPPCVALKSSAALSGERALATLVPALPRARPELTPVLGGTGTWVGTGICDLRASVVSQQKQLDSLIDRVALLLSSMHSEVLQDVRAAVASPDFEARLGEMTKVGEILDQRLAELRAEAQEVPEGVRMLQEELSRVEEKMIGLDERFNQDFEKMQSLVTDSLMSVHDRFTSELEGVVTELKKLEGRLGSAETDLGLLSDEDLEIACKEAIQAEANALRSEFPKFVGPYFDQAATRISALEDQVQREHSDLLLALQAAASGVQEDDRALQRDWVKRTKEDLRQQSEDISALSRQMSEIKSWQSSAMEDAKILRLEAKQREEETRGSVQHLEKQLASTNGRLCQLEEQLKADSVEKRLLAMEELLQGMDEMKAVEQLSEEALKPKDFQQSRDLEERLLMALEEKVDLVVQDLKRQLETQIHQLTTIPREEVPQQQRLEKSLEQRLQEGHSKQQHLLADLRDDLDARVGQVQRQGDEMRGELELKIEKRHSSVETSIEDLKHQIENLSAQQRSVSKKQTDDIKQLGTDVEIRMVKEQSAAHRATLELRKDLEHSAQEAVNLCSEVLREEQQQLVREFRQELERRCQAQFPGPPILEVDGMEEIQEMREELLELKEQLNRTEAKAASAPRSDSGEAMRLLRSVEETMAEKLRRCDAAAERCERLARRMAHDAGPQEAGGSGVPGGKDAYEGMVVQREGPWSLYDSKGRYSFDDTSGWLISAGSKVGRFICKQISQRPIKTSEPGSPKLQILSSDVMTEMQKKENDGAIFVIRSLNGVPSCESSVHHVEDFKHLNSSGARAQLAAHPAVAQFLLDNASNTDRAGGINAMDLLLATDLKAAFEVCNGYLKLHHCAEEVEAENLKNLEKDLHLLRSLIMEDVPVLGASGDQSSMSGEHRVALVYAGLQVEPHSDYQLKVSELILTAQYYGALRYAAESSERLAAKTKQRKVFLTPLGASQGHQVDGRSMLRALSMLSEEDMSRLSVHCVVGDDAIAAEMRGIFKKTSAQSSPARELLFRPSDGETSDENFRPSPIEAESSTESRIMVLMRRVDCQASELQSLRQKNEELSEAVDQYNLQQKVSRSLAGLET